AEVVELAVAVRVRVRIGRIGHVPREVVDDAEAHPIGEEVADAGRGIELAVETVVAVAKAIGEAQLLFAELEDGVAGVDAEEEAPADHLRGHRVEAVVAEELVEGCRREAALEAGADARERRRLPLQLGLADDADEAAGDDAGAAARQSVDDERV